MCPLNSHYWSLFKMHFRAMQKQLGTMTAPWPGERRPALPTLMEGREVVRAFHPRAPDRTMLLI